jgi:hypothetical protein
MSTAPGTGPVRTSTAVRKVGKRSATSRSGTTISNRREMIEVGAARDREVIND